MTTKAFALVLATLLAAPVAFVSAQAPSTPPASSTAAPASPSAAPAAATPAAAATPSAPASARDALVALPDFTALVRSQGPAVVNVITTRAASQGPIPGLSPDDPFYEFFRRFMPDLPRGGNVPREPSRGIGSGFIISSDGYILTNAHVVADADEVTVRMADARSEFKAKVVGADERTDIALLKVDRTGLPVAKLGNSSTLEPGQWVAAIGSPFGLANTITAGIVSATERSLPAETYVPFIQTDVAVNPGNSGGPLLNLQGEVVGINSMIYSRTGGYMGLSFAIPIDAALDVAKQLREQGKVTRGRLGIGIQSLTEELASSFKLDSDRGVVVVQVEPGSPGEKAGLQVGDVILSYNGNEIDEANELPRLVARTRPGNEARIEVWRGGERRTITATVGELPAKTAQASSPGEARPSPGTPSRLGLVVRELQPAELKRMDVEYGLLVVEVEGPASRTAIRPGDVIVAVNQTRFRSVEEFNKLLEAQAKGDSVALLVRRGDNALYVPMEIN